MDKNSKITLMGTFTLEFDTEKEAQEFIESTKVVGEIEYKAYADFYGENKLFQETSYKGTNNG